MQKLYSYVDETGQDTRGVFFLVSVIVTEGEQEPFEVQLEAIEKDTNKGRRKWLDTRAKVQFAYMQRILATLEFQGHLVYALHPNTIDYLPRTVLTAARAITLYAQEDYKVTVLIDGLQKTQTEWVGAELRRLYIKTRKVRGVRKEEASALMRLADALAGFVRAAIMGREDLAALLKEALDKKIIREV